MSLLCPTVSKDLMRDLTVAPGSELASPVTSVDVAGITVQRRLESESDTLTSSLLDLTDKINIVAVPCIQGEKEVDYFKQSVLNTTS